VQRARVDVATRKHIPRAEIPTAVISPDVSAQNTKLAAVDQSKRSAASVLDPRAFIQSGSSAELVGHAAVRSTQQSGEESPAVTLPDIHSFGGHAAPKEVVFPSTEQVVDVAALTELESVRDSTAAGAASDLLSRNIAEDATSTHTAVSSVGVLVVKASLVQQRMVAWISSKAAVEVQVGSKMISLGSGVRWGFAILLAILMLMCALPCVAACCPNRKPGADTATQKTKGGAGTKLERAKTATLRAVRFREGPSVRLEGLNAVLHEVASPRPSADTEEKPPTSFLRAFPSTSFFAAPEAEKSNEQTPQFRSPKESVIAIVKVAKKLDRTVMKYPKSGRGWLIGSKAQSRYIRVQRHPEEQEEKQRTSREERKSQKAADKDPEHELWLWRQGRLGWWESAAAYDNKDKPKGIVLLSKVHGVSIGSDKTIVEVTHQEHNSKKTLEFVFPSSADANSWCEAFLDFLTQIHEGLTDVQLCSEESSSF